MHLIEQLKKNGSKITKARSLLIEILEKNHIPLTETEFRKNLSKSRVSINKTTIYRQLAYLKDKNMIKEVDFGDGKKRYELNSKNHHHHLICTNCNSIDEIRAKDDISYIEKKINKQKQFKVIDHSLEFFGLCQACNK